jgi:phenylacetate-coenzyme A ligase PaaK-like adenylate-forming protein
LARCRPRYSPSSIRTCRLRPCSIRTFGEFQRTVPITTYEDIEPYIDRQLPDEPVQSPVARPVLFVTTSGTTGSSTYIPVTPESKAAKSRTGVAIP